MRAALGLISLLVVLAVVALLTRKTLPPPAVAPVAPLPDIPTTVTTPPLRRPSRCRSNTARRSTRPCSRHAQRRSNIEEIGF